MIFQALYLVYDYIYYNAYDAESILDPQNKPFTITSKSCIENVRPFLPSPNGCIETSKAMTGSACLSLAPCMKQRGRG